MKVSEWLRQYQLTGRVPEKSDDPMTPFWAGWLIAIKAAEFIERLAR